MEGPASSASRWRAVSAGGAELRLEDFLSFRLSRLSTLIQREVTSKYLASAGLSLPDWRVLAGLAQHGALETPQLRRMNLMDKAAISRAVDSLIAQGYAERHADPTHAQRRIVSITPAGRRIVRKIMPVAQREHAALLRLLSVEERSMLDAALGKLTSALSTSHAAVGGVALPGDSPAILNRPKR